MKNLWNSWSLSSKIRGLFSGWAVKEQIARPVIVNVTTALLIFLAALPFKSTIRDFFSQSGGIPSYPLLCVMEPYNKDGSVVIDLFVINQTDELLTDVKLLEFVQQHSPDKENILSHKIVLRIKKNLPGRILEVVNDVAYNENGTKGEAIVERRPNDEWAISIVKINKRAMIKVQVYTDDSRTITSRASHDNSPIEFFYAGRR